jgi:hypothetical protein
VGLSNDNSDRRLINLSKKKLHTLVTDYYEVVVPSDDELRSVQGYRISSKYPILLTQLERSAGDSARGIVFKDLFNAVEFVKQTNENWKGIMNPSDPNWVYRSLDESVPFSNGTPRNIPVDLDNIPEGYVLNHIRAYYVKRRQFPTNEEDY